MHQIYRSGIDNLILLDEADEEEARESASAIDYFTRRVQSAATDSNVDQIIYDRHRQPRYAIDLSAIGVDLHAVLQIFESPWFGRLWVVQEAALPPSSTCLYGSAPIPLLDILRAAQWLWHNTLILPFGDLSAWKVHDAVLDASLMWSLIDPASPCYIRNESGLNLREALEILRQFAATDPKDHLYAVLGLLRSSKKDDLIRHSLLNPDYRRTLNDIFRDAAIYTIEETCDLSFLYDICRRPSDRHDAGWPSWVPYWHRQWVGGLDPTLLSSRFQAGTTASDVVPVLPSGREPDTIGFNGFEVAEVVQVNEPFADDDMATIAGMSRYLAISEAMLQIGDITSGSQENHASILGQILLAGTDYLDRPLDSTSSESLFQAFENYTRTNTDMVALDEVNLHTASGEDTIWLAANFCQAMKTVCRNRRRFATMFGHIGIGPGFMELGDHVVILYGLDWPVVLRPLDDDVFEFIGLAYVYGIMEGQAISERRSEFGEDTTIWLR